MRDTRALYRSDFFPGLGWMLRSELWQEIKCAARPARLPALPALPHLVTCCIHPFLGMREQSCGWFVGQCQTQCDVATSGRALLHVMGVREHRLQGVAGVRML